jgi:hypothetical protein
MSRETERLIRQLAENASPIRPLARPYARTATWLGLSAVYVMFVLLIFPTRHELSSKFHEPLFITEQVAALTTGIAAAMVAFATVIPAFDRRWILLPFLPLAAWLGSLGRGCLQELNRFGLRDLPLDHNPECFPFIVLLGSIPAVAMAIMLRQGAPITPHLTAAFGGLAAAGLGNIVVRLIHPEDVSVMLLVWHVGGVMALSALAGSAGRYFLNWRSIKYRSIR